MLIIIILLTMRVILYIKNYYGEGERPRNYCLNNNNIQVLTHLINARGMIKNDLTKINKTKC